MKSSNSRVWISSIPTQSFYGASTTNAGYYDKKLVEIIDVTGSQISKGSICQKERLKNAFNKFDTLVETSISLLFIEGLSQHT